MVAAILHLIKHSSNMLLMVTSVHALHLLADFILVHVLFFVASGLSGSTAIAQEQVSVGMGLLAGSTVMLITVIWGTCVLVGKCDIENSRAIDGEDTKGFSLLGTYLVV